MTVEKWDDVHLMTIERARGGFIVDLHDYEERRRVFASVEELHRFLTELYDEQRQYDNIDWGAMRDLGEDPGCCPS